MAKVAKLRAEYGNAIPYTEVQKLRSRLLAELRDPSTPGYTKVLGDDMLDALRRVDDTIDEIADVSGDFNKLKEARAATRALKETWSPGKDLVDENVALKARVAELRPDDRTIRMR